MEAIGKVLLVRYAVTSTGMQEEFRITCKRLKGYNLRHRTVFIGNFKLRSPKMGVDGTTATFYEDTSRFYVRNSRAWDIGPGGKRLNEMAGELISYNGKTGKAKMIGRLRGSFDEQ